MMQAETATVIMGPVVASQMQPSMTRPVVALASVGCRTNQQEIASLRALLLDQGFQVTDRAEDADVLVLNSCTVTSGAEAQVRRMLKSISETLPHVKVLVTGCLAQQKPEVVAGMGNVAWVVGNALKHTVPHIIEEGREGIFHSGLEDGDASSAAVLASTFESPSRSLRSRFSLKIQEGCDYRCAYCIVPLVRGAARSAPAAMIVDTARRALDIGYCELVLAGTHIGQYRDGAGTNLAALVGQLLKLPGDFRIRLSSLDPRDLDTALLDVMGDPRVCDHFHISVQSLCDTVLAAMGRGSLNVEGIARVVAEAKTRCPGAAVGGDFIVGFPGESPEDFGVTIGNVKRMGFTYGHVFRYSSRPGTEAAGMDGQVAHHESKRRGEELRTLLRGLRDEFAAGSCGRRARIVVEEADPAAGLTSNYLRVVVDGYVAAKGTWLDTVVTGHDPIANICHGEVHAKPKDQ